MLEPLTALGLAGNVVQLIDFTASLLKESYILLESSATQLPENARIAELATAQAMVYKRLGALNLQTRPLDAAESAVQSAVERCDGKASDLLHILRGLEVPRRPDGTVSRRRQLAVVVKTRIKRPQVEALHNGLEVEQNSLMTALLTLLR